MKMWKWMGIIGGLAILIWLVVPAVRVWRDPSLRSHQHIFQNADPLKRLSFVMEATAPSKRTRVSVGVILVDHKSTFWERYRSLLLGTPWPPGERCGQWNSIRDRFLPKEPAADQPVNIQIEADRMSIAL